MNTNLCRICLRTDKLLKATNSILVEYLDELTDFNIDTAEPLFCSQCEHQLRRHYNFRNRCQRAARVFQKWEKFSGDAKPSIDSLHSEVPNTWSLSVVTPLDADISICSQEEVEDKLVPTVFIDGGSIVYNYENNQPTTQTKQSNNPEQPAEKTTRRLSQRKRKSNKITKEVVVKKCDKTDKTKDDIEIKSDDSDIDFHNNFDDPNDLDYDIKNDIDSLDVPKNESSDFMNYSCDVKVEELSKISDDEEFSLKNEKLKGNFKRKRSKINTEKAKSKNADKPPAKKKTKTSKKADIEEEDDEDDNYLISYKSRSKNNIESDKATPEAERLKEELNRRFEACGELKSSDGVVIDKDYIIECVYRKMKEPTMELLWSRLRGKSTLTPKTIKMLAFLQNRYRRLDKYEDVFNIEYFNTMAKVKEEFENRKNYPAFLGADFKCLICYQKFISEKCLERHARWHKESSGAFVCEICQYRYPTEERLKHHFACFHQAVFKCKMCTYVTYNSENMDGHYSRHMNLKATCELCNKTLANKSILKFHLRTRHSALGPQLRICALCGKSFCEQWFRRHLLKHHGVAGGSNPPIENGVPCETCDVSFPSEEVHQTHIRHVHPEKCTEPLAKKKRKRTENKPKNSGTSETKTDKKPREGRPLGLNGEWTCRVCSAVGKTWGKLTIHFEFEHPDLDMSSVYADTTATLCEICGKGLSNVYSLRDHMRIHTGDRPFACDMCPKRFSRIIGLKGHRLTHFPKSKPCPYCGKMFRQTGNLLNHVRIHVNDRKYKCKVCGKGFLHRQALKEHFNGVHLHVRRVKRPARKGAPDVDRNHVIEEQIIYTGSSEYD